MSAGPTPATFVAKSPPPSLLGDRDDQDMVGAEEKGSRFLSSRSNLEYLDLGERTVTPGPIRTERDLSSNHGPLIDEV